jgi:hypothetical protein
MPADAENTRGGIDDASEGKTWGGKFDIRAESEDERMLASSSFSAIAFSAFEESAEDMH